MPSIYYGDIDHENVLRRGKCSQLGQAVSDPGIAGRASLCARPALGGDLPQLVALASARGARTCTTVPLARLSRWGCGYFKCLPK
jgi:hypothetical protein